MDAIGCDEAGDPPISNDDSDDDGYESTEDELYKPPPPGVDQSDIDIEEEHARVMKKKKAAVIVLQTKRKAQTSNRRPLPSEVPTQAHPHSSGAGDIHSQHRQHRPLASLALSPSRLERTGIRYHPSLSHSSLSLSLSRSTAQSKESTGGDDSALSLPPEYLALSPSQLRRLGLGSCTHKTLSSSNPRVRELRFTPSGHRRSQMSAVLVMPFEFVLKGLPCNPGFHNVALAFPLGMMNNPIFRPLIPLCHTTCSLTPAYRLFSQYNLFFSQPTFLSNALQNYINSDNPYHGQKIHSQILKSGFVPNTNISIKLLILYLKCNCLRYARQMFDGLHDKTLTAYNYMISGYLKQGQVEESLGLVHRLLVSGERLDGFTFSMVLKASTLGCGVPMISDLGRMVHAHIIKSDAEKDEVLYTSLIDSYVKNGRVAFARTVFDVMSEKNVICSTSLISGYMDQGSTKDAECIFRRTLNKDVVVFNAMIEGYSRTAEFAMKSLDVYIDMQRMNFRPNMSTFASIIGACSMLASFEIGQQVQSQLMKTPFFMNIKLGSALIDMYCKCGRIVDARRVFDHMLERNVFTWTSMIDGYGKNGFPDEALELFETMQKDDFIVPNFVTFLSALSACAHAGLVEKGWEIFERMNNEYMVKPGMEHYACMVDMLGRAGRLNQAWEFVMRMPEKPNSDVWAALLSSCRLHGNVEMAKLAADELFKLNSDGRPGAYVALSNTLADAGKWDSVSELREIMKERGISKNTACSWVGADSVY
ncbi:hypothetical protein AHAS_Ahas19G0028900 [Arachis hypogaea]